MTKNPTTSANPTNPTQDVHDELDSTDILVEKVKPYLSKIALFIAVGLLALIATTLYLNSRFVNDSRPWQDFSTATSEFAISGNADSLTQVAAEHPNSAAAMWALQRAGDAQLQNGIGELATDREAGFKQVEKAKECFQQVIAGPNNIKSPMLQQSSVFSMGYAAETLGDFEEASKYYKQLLESAPNSHLSSAAKRGLQRSEDPQYAAAFAMFKDWEGDSEEAPGPAVPDRPNIAFPEFEMPEGESETPAAVEGEPATEPAVSTEEQAVSTEEPVADSE